MATILDPGELFARTVGPVENGGAGDVLPAPRINVEETNDEIRITAELPGVAEKDVQITLDGDLLVIAGEKREDRAQDQGNMRIVERTFGRFHRALKLPFEPDPDKVEARFRDGILTLAVPKEAELRNQARQIEVKRDEGGGSGGDR